MYSRCGGERDGISIRTPCRIDFAGGVTDMPWFYEHRDGHVVNAAIDRFITVQVHTWDCYEIRTGRHSESARTPYEVLHPMIRETLLETNADPVFIRINSDVTPFGSGLGSSASLIVGLAHAVYYLKHGKSPLRDWLFETACKIEMERLGRSVGKQDPYAAVHGGLRSIKFIDNFVTSEVADFATVNYYLMLFDIKGSHNADTLLKDHATEVRDGLEAKAIADHAYAFLEEDNIRGFAQCLNECFKSKQRLIPDYAGPGVIEVRDRALRAGALGAALGGAGKGGHLILLASPYHQQQVEDAFEGYAKRVRCRIVGEGSIKL